MTRRGPATVGRSGGGSDNQLTVPQVVAAIAHLKERGGSRYTEIRNALAQFRSVSASTLNFLQIKAVLFRACKEGLIRQTARGRWMLNIPHFRPRKEVGASLRKMRPNKMAAASSSSFHRLRRRRGKWRHGKCKRKQKKRKKKKKRRRRRRRRGRKGRKGKRGKKKRRRLRKRRGRV